MNNILKLNNDYYVKILDSGEKMPNKAIAVNNLNIMNILKDKYIFFKIDFDDLNVKNYKKTLKKVLFTKHIAYLTKRKLGFKDNDKIVLAYIINYDKQNTKHNDFIAGINAIAYKTRLERYNYIYDYVCDYLDSFFYGKNLCDFKNNKCGEKRNTSSTTGCCHHFKHKFLGPLSKLVLCEYLNKENYTCDAKCLPCKLFTCDYLESKGIKFRIKDILLLDTFFNPLQKYFIKYMVFTPKEKILKRLIKL